MPNISKKTCNSNTIYTTKSLKRKKLRYLEYYDFQAVLDELYAESRRGRYFTNLMDFILDERNMSLAYRNIKRNAGSTTRGTDGTTIEDWEHLDPQDFYDYIRSSLSDYKPSPVRRVMIPKPNGKLRPLGIPNMCDRLIQQCILQILEPICEAKFYDYNFGFRPNRSTKHALAHFSAIVNISRCYHVVDMDIKGFFDNVNHGKLLKQLWTLGIHDKNLLSIISKMLKSEIEGEGIPTKGVPQGGIISPLLSNVVLNELDHWIADQWETFKTDHKYYSTPSQKRNATYKALRKGSNLKEIYIVRYADDFKILCRTSRDAKKIYHATVDWLDKRLGLEVSPEKSRIIDLRKDNSEFLGLRFKLRLMGNKQHKLKLKGRKTPTEVKWRLYSHMTDKSINKVKQNLVDRIKDIQKHPTKGHVNLYNSTLLGSHLYYNCATMVNLDFNRIAFDVNKVIRNRTNNYQQKYRKDKRCKASSLKVLDTDKSNKDPPNKLSLSSQYIKYYGKNNYKKTWIANTALYPIADVQFVKTKRFNQTTCNFTVKGRAKIHRELHNITIGTLHYLARNPVRNRSIEYNDNRVSLFSAQSGVCAITDCPLQIGNLEVHHVIPISKGGTDRYRNLILVTHDVHRLLHAVSDETVVTYLKRIESYAPITKEVFGRINRYRTKLGNAEISKGLLMLEGTPYDGKLSRTV